MSSRIPNSGWRAELALRYERDRSRTVLAGRRHEGPLRVQKALYPEGEEVCQTLIVHPPGGVVAGDQLAIDLQAGANTRVQVTTPGASKWYRSTGPTAAARTAVTASAGSIVEWLPQETILFDGARASITNRINLAADSVVIGWDIVAFGRAAAGEPFATGRFKQSWELYQADRLIWCERTVLDGGSPALQSGAVLGGAPVTGTMFVAGVRVPDEALASCRRLAMKGGEAGVSRLQDIWLARCRGTSAIEARMYFASLWALLRPVCAGRHAVPPRIWAT